MASMKRGAVVASTLMLIAVIASACNQPYSQAPSVTNTPINPTSLFATPIGGTPEITMSDIANFGTSTALAQTGTPLAVETQTLAVGVTPQDLSATATPLVAVNPALTSTATLAVNSTLPTSAPVGSRPAEYTLHKGEFPYCLARRFDVDPGQLLSLNGLTNGGLYYPNRTLKIPQSGSFPGNRALQTHLPYTVRSSDETMYSIACLFGDVRPEDIATANGFSSADAALTVGKSLSIP